MKPFGILIPLIFLSQTLVGLGNEEAPADALLPEQVRDAIAKLDDPNFHQRETAGDQLYGLGMNAVFALQDVAENGSLEASVRAFDILTRLYRLEDEPTYEAVEWAFKYLMRTDEVGVTSRAERLFDSLADLRQVRGVAKFKSLGGVIRFEDQNPGRQAIGLSPIEFILIDRNWKGTDEDVRLIENIQDVHVVPMTLILIRGVSVSDKTLFELRTALPLLSIQPRGPARLGVKHLPRSEGCVIDRVEPGSTAQNAGLESNDLITEIDGEQIDSFELLVKIIERHEAGDKVPIVFIRRGEVHKVVAELLPWNQDANSAKP